MISILVHFLGHKATVNRVDENFYLLFDRIVCELKVLVTVMEKFVLVVHGAL